MSYFAHVQARAAQHEAAGLAPEEAMEIAIAEARKIDWELDA